MTTLRYSRKRIYVPGLGAKLAAAAVERGVVHLSLFLNCYKSARIYGELNKPSKLCWGTREKELPYCLLRSRYSPKILAIDPVLKNPFRQSEPDIETRLSRLGRSPYWGWCLRPSTDSICVIFEETEILSQFQGASSHKVYLEAGGSSANIPIGFTLDRAFQHLPIYTRKFPQSAGIRP